MGNVAFSVLLCGYRVVMGSPSSKEVDHPPPPVDLPRSNNVRASIRSKVPMPDQNELERRFTKVLVSQQHYKERA